MLINVEQKTINFEKTEKRIKLLAEILKSLIYLIELLVYDELGNQLENVDLSGKAENRKIGKSSGK